MAIKILLYRLIVYSAWKIAAVQLRCQRPGNIRELQRHGVYYYLRNGQNDIVGLMDGSGVRVVEYIYDAWGKLISTTGTLATTLGADNPFRYRGYYYDTETGLYYLTTRYYDPEVCRFISADVYMSTGQGVLGGNKDWAKWVASKGLSAINA